MANTACRPFQGFIQQFPLLGIHISKEKKGDFWIFSYYVRYSTLLHLPPLRFHCDRGFWHRTQDFWYFTVRRNTHLAIDLIRNSAIELIHNSAIDLIHNWALDLIHNSAIGSHPQLGYRSHPQLG
jgi:hypothetical protein